MYEETGLICKINKLLYVCDVPPKKEVLHITFLMDIIDGSITLPTNEFDENPISDVRFVGIDSLEEYGFSSRFKKLIQNGFNSYGSYKMDKSNIGLDI